MTMAPPGDEGTTAAPERKLSNRHIQFIALGGAIGAGLFLGSGKSIALAGPGAIVAYAVCGVFIFLMARALGELTLREPSRDAFIAYATRNIGPVAGFVTGWSYWANWVLVGAAEITATSVFMRYWYPAIPQWIPAAVTLAAVYAANMKAVRLFGEVEFWLAIVKVLTIVLLIMGGLLALFTPFLPVAGANVHNLVDHGGLFPRGWGGIVEILPIALFAFGGVEVIALTAHEAQDPHHSIPRAINAVVARILILYVGSMLVAMSVAPWTSYSADPSPFVAIMTRIGIPAAAGIVNFVVLTAVVSSCNTGLFSTGRMLAGLARTEFAPAALGRTDADGLPRRSISVSAACLALAVLLNWLIPDRALGVLMAAVAYLLLWVWIVVLLSHRGMRRRAGSGAAGTFAMPFYPLSSWATIAFIAGAVLLLVVEGADTVATLAAGMWFVGLTLFALLRRFVPHPKPAGQQSIE